MEKGISFGHVNQVKVFEAFFTIVRRESGFANYVPPGVNASNFWSSERVNCSDSRKLIATSLSKKTSFHSAKDEVEPLDGRRGKEKPKEPSRPMIQVSAPTLTGQDGHMNCKPQYFFLRDSLPYLWVSKGHTFLLQ